jgi:putative acetyltransferase
VVNPADQITVELVSSATDDVRGLIGELDQLLSAEYPPEQRHGLPLDAIFEPNIRLFLARLNGAAVGCGGVALFSDFAEVKRMYVRDVARGRGVAQALLERIEKDARDAGHFLLQLETGVRQTAALRFYRRAGFQIAQHSAPTPQWRRRPSLPACSCKSDWKRASPDDPDQIPRRAR